MKYLWIENIESYPAIVYQEIAPNENFVDKSNDILLWDSSTNILDWSRRRDFIKSLFYAEAGLNLENFGILSTEKKLIGCKYFFIPYSLRIQIITEEQDLLNWSYLLCQTKQSRVDCVEAMRVKVGHYIRTEIRTLEQTQSFYKDVSDMVIWFNEVNAPDLKQWITNEVGSQYELNGFAQKSYYLESIKNDLIDIYNGNY